MCVHGCSSWDTFRYIPFCISQSQFLVLRSQEWCTVTVNMKHPAQPSSLQTRIMLCKFNSALNFWPSLQHYLICIMPLVGKVLKLCRQHVQIIVTHTQRIPLRYVNISVWYWTVSQWSDSHYCLCFVMERKHVNQYSAWKHLYELHGNQYCARDSYWHLGQCTCRHTPISVFTCGWGTFIATNVATLAFRYNAKHKTAGSFDNIIIFTHHDGGWRRRYHFRKKISK